MIAWAVLAVFVVIQALDILSTKRGIDLGASEAMPLGRWMFERFGVLKSAIILKALFVAAALTITCLSANALWFTLPLTTYGAWVVWHNWQVIKTL